MKILIIEDEPVAAKRLTSVLSKIDATIEVVFISNSISKSVEWISNNPKPDLILMDVELADGKSFEIFKQVSITAPVVFITSYDEYAINAIKHSAIDYLLKPVDQQELAKAIDKVKVNFSSVKQSDLVNALLNVLKPDTGVKKLPVSSMDGITYLDIEKIIRLSSDSNYTTIMLTDGKKIIASKTLGEFETLLKPYSFFRVHNSHLINLNFVDKYSRIDGGMVILKDGSEVEISKTKKKELHDLLSLKSGLL